MPTGGDYCGEGTGDVAIDAAEEVPGIAEGSPRRTDASLAFSALVNSRWRDIQIAPLVASAESGLRQGNHAGRRRPGYPAVNTPTIFGRTNPDVNFPRYDTEHFPERRTSPGMAPLRFPFSKTTSPLTIL